MSVAGKYKPPIPKYNELAGGSVQLTCVLSWCRMTTCAAETSLFVEKDTCTVALVQLPFCKVCSSSLH